MSTANANEQLMLELINRARSNPLAEMQALFNTGKGNIDSAVSYFANYADLQDDGIDNNSYTVADLQATAISQVQGNFNLDPLAWNDNLATSADTHNDLMISMDTQSHNLPGEPSSYDRFVAGGYDLSAGWAIGESVFGFTEDPLQGHAGYYIDWGFSSTGIQQPAGHRDSILSSSFKEIGIAYTAVPSSNAVLGPNSTTQHFGYSSNNPSTYLLGVVIDDLDGDDFYDIGEGLSGITITATSATQTFTTTSWAAGGYQMELAPNTVYDITFSGAALGADQTFTTFIGSGNTKLDVETVAFSGNTGPQITSAASAIVNENSTWVINVEALDDSDTEGNGLSYSLNGGADVSFFTINANTGVLSFLEAPDFETPLDGGTNNTYNLRVSVTDSGGLSDTQNIAVTIMDIDEIVDPEGAFSGATPGPDNLNGTEVADEGSALDGNDTVRGRGGDDTIDGAGGNDQLRGQDGNDNLSGGPDNDQIYGNSGNDVLSGDDGNDVMFGNIGDDNLNGGSGNDQMSGNEDNDTLTGGEGDDSMFGGTGNDRISGNAGVDLIQGDDGMDTVNGGADGDEIFGGKDDDVLAGDAGDDLIIGNQGDDDISGGADDDRLFGIGGADTLDGGTGIDVMFGGTGDDLVSGGNGADKLFGENDNDTLDGGANNDKLYGGNGNDSLDGGAGSDELFGDDGNDFVGGGSDADTLFGGAGDDTLDGGRGSGIDRVTGGGGADTFVYQSGDARLVATDFDASEGDQIDLVGINPSNFGNWTLTSLAGGNSSLIEFGGGNELRLDGVGIGEIEQSWFI